MTRLASSRVIGPLADAFFSSDLKRFHDVCEPVRFESRSEVACAVLLERYLPEWECRPGLTFQIPVGSKRFDFRVNHVVPDTFVEYHPIKLLHEFHDRRAYHMLTEAFRLSSAHVKDLLRAGLEAELTAQYIKKRRDLLVAAGMGSARLVCCFCPHDFYRQVLKPLAHCAAPEAAVLREFKRIVESIEG